MFEPTATRSGDWRPVRWIVAALVLPGLAAGCAEGPAWVAAPYWSTPAEALPCAPAGATGCGPALSQPAAPAIPVPEPALGVAPGAAAAAVVGGAAPMNRAMLGVPGGVLLDNPMLLPIADQELAWNQVVDVVDDYFQIDREEPVRQIGNTLTEGRLATFPKTGATLLEPWDGDSASPYERLESTLQSIRRYAQVRVIPAGGAHWVEVNVYKELEDLRRPEMATVGAATFRYDDSLTRVTNPVVTQAVHEGWIPQGRDPALEQRILAELRARCCPQTAPMFPSAPSAVAPGF